jgi:hypothetical protein
MLLLRPNTVDELVTTIYEDNFGHFDFIENMNGGDCDCALHLTMKTIEQTMGWTDDSATE